ncbi:hypothetical protein ACTXGQ_22730, partial [Marinobacter sp. 1Y8]
SGLGTTNQTLHETWACAHVREPYSLWPMKDKSTNFSIYESEGILHLSIGENYKYSPTSILAYVLNITTTKVLAKKSWLLTDDYQAEFEYKGHVFVLCTPMDSVDIFPYDQSAPNEIIHELFNYIQNFKAPPFTKLITTFVKCFFLPWNYEP